MPINFPNSPSPSQLYSYDNKTWEWNGTYWEVYSALTSYVGGSGNTDYVPKWFNSNTITDSQIYDDGSQVYIPTLSATTYQNLPVSAVTSGTGISASTSNGVVTVSNTQVQGITGITAGSGISANTTNNVTTITNTSPDQTVTLSGGTGITTGGTYPNFTITNSDLGSSQNIFKNIQVGGVTQFSAGSNSSNLNFSGVNITITSAATNTLVFSAGTGGVTSISTGTGLSGNSTTGAVTLQLSASSYSMFVNNTASAGVQSQVTYKDTGDASFSSIVTWATTTPSPTAGDYRYRWTQIGNMVWFYFNWTSVSIGAGAISWTMPTDMPNPAIPTGFNAALYALHRYTCSFGSTVGGPVSGTITFANTTLLVLRRNSGNTAWEWIIPATTTIRWFSATGHYFV